MSDRKPRRTGKPHVTRVTRGLPIGVDRPLEPEVMAPAESVAFLLERTGAGELGREAAERLAEELGHLPLALEQAAAYVTEYGVSLSAYLDSWRQRRVELLETLGPKDGGYEAIVATTWAVSFARVEAASPASADVLRIAAFLAPDAIPEELFAEAAQHLGPALAAKAAELSEDELAIGELLAPLARVSLIRRQPEERTFGVHRMAQEAVRTALGAGGGEWLGRAVEGLNALAPYQVDSPSSWPRLRRILLHAQALAAHLTGAAVVRASAGRLLNQAAFFLLTQDRHAEARTLADQALAIHRRVLGYEHPHTLASISTLAETLRAQGDLSDARELHEQTLAVRRRVLGKEHPDTLKSMNNLALTLRAQGDLAGARGLFERSLAVYRRQAGEEHPATLTLMNNLGLTLANLGDLRSAQAMLRQAAEGSRRVLGEGHPDTKLYEENLARLEASLAAAPPEPEPSS